MHNHPLDVAQPACISISTRWIWFSPEEFCQPVQQMLVTPGLWPHVAHRGLMYIHPLLKSRCSSTLKSRCTSTLCSIKMYINPLLKSSPLASFLSPCHLKPLNRSHHKSRQSPGRVNPLAATSILWPRQCFGPVDPLTTSITIHVIPLATSNALATSHLWPRPSSDHVNFLATPILWPRQPPGSINPMAISIFWPRHPLATSITWQYQSSGRLIGWPGLASRHLAHPLRHATPVLQTRRDKKKNKKTHSGI
eukprot:jgi/Botrbrau1/644/Bobra.0161s0033.1